MSILRRAAQKISAMVVRYSSAGSKEWAEGLAREVDFIRSDWGALLWSMGSLRVLLDRRPAPIRTYDDLRTLVERFAQAARQTRVWGLLCTLYLLHYCYLFYESRNVSEHVGTAMMAVGWTISGIYAIAHWRTKQTLFANKGTPELIGYYRDYLEDQVNWVRSRKMWLGLGSSLLIFIGIAVANPRFRSGWKFDFIVLLFLVIIASLPYAGRNARRRLQELDVLFASGQMSFTEFPSSANGMNTPCVARPDNFLRRIMRTFF